MFFYFLICCTGYPWLFRLF